MNYQARPSHVEPLWTSIPSAIRRLNRATLFRTVVPTIFSFAGFRRIGSVDRPCVLTCSVWEDQARLWYRFVERYIDRSAWDIVIVDSTGRFQSSHFPNATLLRLANVYHGKRLDWLFYRILAHGIVLCLDDDKCLLSCPDAFLQLFKNPKVAAVSLQPRLWWHFEIDGIRHEPMGSYAVMLDRRLLTRHRLSLRPSPAVNRYRVSHAGTKSQPSFDTADLANLRLLQLGYDVITVDDPVVMGFDGMTAPRVLARYRGRAYVRSALWIAPHFRQGSTNGAVLRGLYCAANFETLFTEVFGEEPSARIGLHTGEIRQIVCDHELLDPREKEHLTTYFDSIDGVRKTLAEALL